MLNKYQKDNFDFFALHNELIKVTDSLNGSKSLLASKYCERYPQGIVTCGSRFSIQVLSFAKTCEKLNVPCIVCIPSGKETDMIKQLKNTNATIKYISPAYNTVLNARARETASELGYGYVPLGMLEEFAFEIISNIVLDNIDAIKNVNRIIVPVGSGTTLIGVAYGIKKAKLNIPILGVMVGMDATKNIFKKNLEYINGCNITLVKSEDDYNKQINNDIIPDLNKTYEAKCLPYIQGNDLFWIVDK